MRNINKVVVHCSDSDYPQHDNVETIYKWHVDERGWSDIGYHFVITKDGKINLCRPIPEIGSHCKGHNSNSIGICLTGQKVFSSLQFDALDHLLRQIMDVYPEVDVCTHHHLNDAKTCPNFDLKQFAESYHHDTSKFYV